MSKYKIGNLNVDTPRAAQGRLINALRTVTGVGSAVIHPNSSELEIIPRPQQQPERSAIAAAVSKAGFSLDSAE
jgi:hypothetical protein